MSDAAPIIRIPETDALVLGAAGGVLLSPDGEIETLGGPGLRRRLNGDPLLVCHARSIARRESLTSFRAYDLLELFAFVHPAQFCVPTPRGLAEILSLPPPRSLEECALILQQAAVRLLSDLTAPGREDSSDAAGIAWSMARAGWLWGPLVLAALGKPYGATDANNGRSMQVWHRLPEWEPDPPPPPPAQHSVEPAAARERLALLLGDQSEERPQQADYASAVCESFTPRREPDGPNTVLAEAGTGVGKTLGYLAPASLWAEKNGAPVWISTYTRNLQHQIDRELDRLHPRPDRKAGKVVLRKGRENYLCLLNLEEATRALPAQPQYGIALGLMARWTAATRDGDMSGGDFPGWLADLIGRGRSLGLADRRGECVYSACSHYSRCFIERSVRRARKADIVVANHALVMIQAALGGMDDTTLPTRYVFDEGHHLFDAADSAFAGHLTGQETAELRRWLIGMEGGRRSRARGLKRRIDDLLGDDEDARAALDEVERAARALPGEGWAGRVGKTEPSGATEHLLTLIRAQTYARAAGVDSPYDLECDTVEPVDGLIAASKALDSALKRLQKPLKTIGKALRARLDDEADRLDSQTRLRLDAMARALDRRAQVQIKGWRDMLETLGGQTPELFVDWFGVERAGPDGKSRDVDFGYYRHWVDPTRPFAEALSHYAHGMVVTSATLTDGTGDPEADWQAAEALTGAVHLPRPATRAAVPSPFDYAGQTRVLVVRDVRKDDFDQVGAAYRALFEAAGGGGLGLFTAISRLREVHGRIARPLEQAGIALHAQHVDGIDVATLVDIFRAEPDSCLLGTDAVRDGIDVPGRSLRLIVFDRVPWPRPNILHRARREHFGKRRYDDMITRLRLKQAYGRLIRQAGDHGVFVMLDPMMPSRLAGAFPDGVEVERLGLAEAVGIVRDFLPPDGV